MNARLSDLLAFISQGLYTMRCPVPGCGLRIRYVAVSDEEEKRLQALVADHSRYGRRHG
ncbi:hypothetical protein ABZ752_22780 [Streptomyces roseifaciens]